MIDASMIRAYQSLRETGKEFHSKVMALIPRHILVSTAEELGLGRKGVFVADAGDTDVFADRMIYDKKWEGKNSLEHFEGKSTVDALTENERRFFNAMKTGSFSLFRISGTHPGSHVVLFNRLMEIRTGQPQPPVELIDLGLSQTGLPGALLATRLLDAGGFHMTSGVSFPFDPDSEATIIKYLREKEFGYRRKRLDLPENYSLYFLPIAQAIGIEVRYEAEDEE